MGQGQGEVVECRGALGMPLAEDSAPTLRDLPCQRLVFSLASQLGIGCCEVVPEPQGGSVVLAQLLSLDRPDGRSGKGLPAIYGLVNVRTDGEKILCAVMNEKDHSWQVKTITSRF